MTGGGSGRPSVSSQSHLPGADCRQFADQFVGRGAHERGRSGMTEADFRYKMGLVGAARDEVGTSCSAFVKRGSSPPAATPPSGWRPPRGVRVSTWVSNGCQAARPAPSGAVFRYNFLGAPVAQWIEQRFPKPCVAGSSPARGPTFQIRKRPPCEPPGAHQGPLL